MRSRKEIEQQYKTFLIPADRKDVAIQLELLLDIRDLLSKDSQVEAARSARKKSILEKNKKILESMR